MKGRLHRFMYYGYPGLFLLFSMYLIFYGKDGIQKLTGVLAALISLMMYQITAERIKYYKYRRLYNHELNRRVATDKAFNQLRSQFDAEIIQSRAELQESETAEGHSGREEPSDDYMRGYVQGLVHGRDLIPTKSPAEQEDTGDGRSGWRARRHLRLVKSSHEAE
ncbi:hypothetical protein [Streptomyces sp. NPDC020983]|uniref:hypothetical protein n=1 Tax=Streptomyces sp. NPDC020983 TaxID=3365106 RepID=UPI0037A02FF2